MRGGEVFPSDALAGSPLDLYADLVLPSVKMLDIRVAIRLMWLACWLWAGPVAAAPVGDTAKLLVASETISIDDVSIVKTATLDDRSLDWKIDRLFRALETRKTLILQVQPSPVLRCLLDVAPAVPFLVLRRVLYTCILAGYGPELEGRSHPLWRRTRTGEHDGHVESRLLVTNEGFRLLDAPGSPKEVQDIKSLGAQLAELRRVHPNEPHMVIVVDDRVSYARLRTVDDLVIAAGFPSVLFLPPLTRGEGVGESKMGPPNPQLKESIRKVIQSHRAEVTACYESGLARNPELEGKVVVTWTLGPDGRVWLSRVVSSTLRDDEVKRCVLDASDGWRFPSHPSSVLEVSYPFVFVLK